MTMIKKAFCNIKTNKKEFHKSKQPIDLNLVDTNKIVISDKLSIVMMFLNILLVTKKLILLTCYV